MNKVKGFVKRETVLSAAVILAILSAMVIRPDREYGLTLIIRQSAFCFV